MSDSAAKWDEAEPAASISAPRGFVSLARHYAPSVLGPISVSAAHFLASLIFLRELPPANFGQFAFLLVIAPFLSVSAAGSLLSAALGRIGATDSSGEDTGTSILLKACLAISVVTGILTFFLLRFSHAPFHVALILAPYTALSSLRSFGRAVVFAEGKPGLAMVSDLGYSVSLTIGLLLLLKFGHFSIDTAAQLLTLSAIVGTVALGASYLKRQFWQLGSGSLSAYLPVWRDFTRWSLLGVVMSELTANAHAYLVTFFAGPKAFAVLAIGALVMRPVSLVLGALPDFERPRMARAVADNDIPRALQSVNEFRTAGSAIWIVTLGLAVVLLLWFPQVLLKGNYDEAQVLIVLLIWAVIMAARILRTPEGILLQAAGEFKSLASASTKASVASVIATVVLLAAFGPLAALGGILIGELVMTAATVSVFRGWKAGHG